MNAKPIDRIIRESEVKEMIGLRSTTRLKEMIDAQEFPAPVIITPGGRATGFVLREVQEYIQARIKSRDEHPPQPRPPQPKHLAAVNKGRRRLAKGGA